MLPISFGRCSAAALVLLVACGGSGDRDDGDGSGGAGSGSGASGGSGGSGGTKSGGSGGSVTDACSRFEFVASGLECPSSGCPSVSCGCEDEGFPVSISECTPDGCIVSGNCEAMCVEELEDIFDCTGSYTVSSGGSSGSGGTSASGGTGGTGGTTAMCSPDDVAVAAESATPFATTLVSVARGFSDESGNLYVAGQASSSSEPDFGGGELPDTGSLFLVKLDAEGQHEWSRRFGTQGVESPPETVTVLAPAEGGGVWVGGRTGGETDLGGGAEPSSPSAQIFAVRYDEEGDFVASYLMPLNDTNTKLVGVVETADEVQLWGNFEQPFSAASDTLTPAGDTEASDIFVVRFSPEGTILGGERYGDVLDDALLDVVGAGDNIYLAGVAANFLDFGGASLALEPDTGFVAALDSTLSQLWLNEVGGPGMTHPKQLRISGANLVVGGDSTGDGNVYYASQPAGEIGDGNLFVLHVDLEDGTLQNGAVFESLSPSARLHSLAVTPNGDILLGGVTNPPVDFGDGEQTTPFDYQPFLARVDDAGDVVWSTLFCSENPVQVPVVGHDDDGSVAILHLNGSELELGSTQITLSGALYVEMPAGN